MLTVSDRLSHLRYALFLPIIGYLLVSVSVAQAEHVWRVAPGRSSVEFKVKHFLLMNVKGKFRKYNGKVITKTPNEFSGAHVEASIPVESIYTGNDDRDAHLLTSDFFNAEEYPEMKFTSTSVTKITDDTYKMVGTINIRGITKEVVFDVVHQADRMLANGKKCCIFKATASLNRYDFGLRWNEMTETGGIAVSELVTIEMNIALEGAA